uniref:restriction endonuclease n=1 Tax=Dickeya oryzae TaxID=1240404 RepID=UPI003F65B27F
MLLELMEVLFVFAGITLFITYPWRRREKASTRRHRRYRASAERVLMRLPTLAGDGQRLAYLRRVSPYVFEELLLLAFERYGLQVIRNVSYSGDGGIDGQVFIHGRRWLIQAKRYKNAISPRHVSEFSQRLIQHQCGGFFIHTGRTGNKSWKHASGERHSNTELFIISGQRLLALLAGKPNWINTIGVKHEKTNIK